MDQINLTLGTAGHIDHGKTALVKNLTGCETDRLKEEKERGMSIELGFAPCTIAGTQVGIVDVPGHENFVKTMVAGASGMDGVLLVVAADDGVMPQTREHLDILTLLGVRHGIVALTKIDRVAPEHRDAVCADVARLLHGTYLEDAPILPVSNVTGEGFDAFLEALWNLVQTIPRRNVDGVFRLPLERGFSIPGYGTVVAGIPVAGAARVGDEIVLLPHNLTGKIRRIEVYGKTSDAVMAGQCAAINVGHWDHRAIRRGDTLTLPGYFSPQEWYVCSARLLIREKLSIKSGAEVRFHTGTSDVAATFYPLHGNRMESGSEGLIQIRAKTPVVAGPGDHFLLRTQSPVRTIGGGVVVEAVEGRQKGRIVGVAADLKARADAVLDRNRFVEYCIRTAPSLAVTESALAVRAKLPTSGLQTILADLTSRRRVFSLAGRLCVHEDVAAEAANRLLEMVEAFHRQSPDSPGVPLDSLRQSMPIEKAVFDALIARLKGEGRLVERNQRLASPSHRATFEDQDARLLEAIETLFRQSGFSPPGVDEIVASLGVTAGKIAALLAILREHGRLVQVEEGMLFHSEAIDRARGLLATHFANEGRLESVQFKYLLGTTRKYALPLLDYMDRLGVSRRVGNTRYPKNLPGKPPLS